MESRPKIKLPLSELDRNLELTGKILLVILWCLTLYSFFKLPATVPTHFNIKGQADAFGNKSTLFILPVLGTGIYFLITFLNKFPHLFNYIKKITEDNAESQYSIATRLLRCLKLSMLLLFLMIILFTYLTAIGITNGLGSWFFPFGIGLMLAPTIAAINHSRRKVKINGGN